MESTREKLEALTGEVRGGRVEVALSDDGRILIVADLTTDEALEFAKALAPLTDNQSWPFYAGLVDALEEAGIDYEDDGEEE